MRWTVGAFAGDGLGNGRFSSRRAVLSAHRAFLFVYRMEKIHNVQGVRGGGDREMASIPYSRLDGSGVASDIFAGDSATGESGWVSTGSNPGAVGGETVGQVMGQVTGHRIPVEETVAVIPAGRLLLRIVPSWAISMVLHIGVLVGLAALGHVHHSNGGLALRASFDEAVALEDLNVDFSQATTAASAASSASLRLDRIQPETVLEITPLDSQAIVAMEMQPRMALDGDGLWGTTDSEGIEGLLPIGPADFAIDDDNSQGDRAQFFGVSARGKKFVFLVDCSGSMRGVRWNSARNELIRSLRNLQEEQLFCVLLYSSQSWSYNGNVSLASYMTATPENLDLVSAWLNAQSPGGGTLPLPSVKEGLGLKPDAMFLLSDGELQDDSRGFLLRNNARQSAEDVTPVHTISAGLGYGAELLQVIAGENGGVFRQVW